MVDPAADVVLLSSVALRGLVIVPWLLLWILPLPTIVLMTWGILDSPLGAVVSIVPQFSTLEASVARSRGGVGVPHRRTGGSVLTVLREVGAWRQLFGAWSLRSLLILTLVLILPIVDILTSRTERCSLWRCKTRVAVA